MCHYHGDPYKYALSGPSCAIITETHTSMLSLDHHVPLSRRPIQVCSLWTIMCHYHGDPYKYALSGPSCAIITRNPCCVQLSRETHAVHNYHEILMLCNIITRDPCCVQLSRDTHALFHYHERPMLCAIITGDPCSVPLSLETHALHHYHERPMSFPLIVCKKKSPSAGCSTLAVEQPTTVQ